MIFQFIKVWVHSLGKNHFILKVGNLHLLPGGKGKRTARLSPIHVVSKNHTEKNDT